MRQSDQTHEADNERIVLGLLMSVESNGTRSQRHIASELGIALGLVNAYLKRAVRKGLVKVRKVPARRYAYYLTPQGFSEKSRLTVEFLSSSFSFFRRAKDDCALVYEQAAKSGFHSLVLAGKSDLCEVAILCALERPLKLVAIVDAEAATDRFVGVSVAASYDDVAESFDAIVVTDLRRSREVFDQAVSRLGGGRVLVPALLGISPPVPEGERS